MIRSRASAVLRTLVVLLSIWLGPVSAWADEAASEPSEETVEDADEATESSGDTLSAYQQPFSILAERTIGTTSRAVEFNWRRTRVHVGGQVALPFELNSFDSLRVGGLLRIPRAGGIFELGTSYVWVWDTPSTEMLALTPYRQPGRPWRISLEGNFGLPLAEGLVTASPRWFPALTPMGDVNGSIPQVVELCKALRKEERVRWILQRWQHLLWQWEKCRLLLVMGIKFLTVQD